MATQSTMRQRVRNKLYSLVPPYRPFADTLNDTLAASAADVTVTVTLGGSWQAGDIVELPGGEQLYVTAVSVNNLTVIRAHNGTTLETAATGITLLKNPRFDLATIDQSITDCLLALENQGVYAFGYGSLTLVAGQDTYQPAETDILDVIALYYEQDTSLDPVAVPFAYKSRLHATPFTGTHVLIVRGWGEQAAGELLYYTYKQKIDSVTDLLARQEEIVIWGACYRLLLGTVVPETHDPGKRTNRTVQPGQTNRDSARLRFEYMEMVRLEHAILETELAGFLPGDFRIGRGRRWKYGA